MFIIIHAGYSDSGISSDYEKKILRSIGKKISAKYMENKHKPNLLCRLAVDCLFLLEKSGFNAGATGTLQADGARRNSAMIMDGQTQKISGIINAENMPYPSRYLPWIHTKNLGIIAPIPEKLWRASSEKSIYNGGSKELGTVGCIVFINGKICVGSSTGGLQGAFPGRVGDTCITGNYASPFCGVVSSGIGEQINRDGLAVRIETRVRDGMPIAEASEKTFRELKGDRRYGWIAVDSLGNVASHASGTFNYVKINLATGDVY